MSADIVNAAITAAPLQPWHRLDPSSWIRQCFAGEALFSILEMVSEGTGQMPVFVSFSTNIAEAELIERVRNAWLSCHAAIPNVAIAISEPNDAIVVSSMAYTILRSEIDAKEWLQDTFEVISHESAADLQRALYQGPLTTRGRRSKLYLILAPETDSDSASHHALLWHNSHVVVDAFSRQQVFDQLFRKIVEGPSDKFTVDGLDYSKVFDRLPIPVASAYEAQVKPTEEQRQQGLKELLARSQMIRSKVCLMNDVLCRLKAFDLMRGVDSNSRSPALRTI
jgi:hypothetical protein